MQKIYQKIDGKPALVAIIDDNDYATIDALNALKNKVDELPSSELITNINEQINNISNRVENIEETNETVINQEITNINNRIENLEKSTETLDKIAVLESDLASIRNTIDTVATQDDIDSINGTLTEMQEKLNSLKNMLFGAATTADPDSEEFNSKLESVEEGGFVAIYEDSE